MIDLEQFKERISELAKRLSLRRLDLVGSAARDDFSDDSDVDMLVTFDSDENLVDRYFALKSGLEHIFERKVDLIEERAIRNPYFKQSVENDRIKIYGT